MQISDFGHFDATTVGDGLKDLFEGLLPYCCNSCESADPLWKMEPGVLRTKPGPVPGWSV